MSSTLILFNTSLRDFIPIPTIGIQTPNNQSIYHGTNPAAVRLYCPSLVRQFAWSFAFKDSTHILMNNASLSFHTPTELILAIYNFFFSVGRGKPVVLWTREKPYSLLTATFVSFGGGEHTKVLYLVTYLLQLLFQGDDLYSMIPLVWQG